MTPDFQLLANDKDVTAVFRDRLIQIRTTDEAGLKSDSLEIRLDDRERKIILPQEEAELVLKLGFKESGLVTIGKYKVSGLRYMGPGELTISADAADMKKSMKAPRTKSWDNITLGDLVRTIAARHDLEPKTSGEHAAIALGHIDQSNESDLNLLTRIARQFDLTVKPVHGFLVVVKKGDGKSISGKALPIIKVSAEDLQPSWEWDNPSRGKYAAVRAFWHDTGAAEKKSVLAGNGEPVFEMRNPFDNAEAAQIGARARLDKFQRGEATLALPFRIGRPDLKAEGRIDVSGLHPAIDGRWSMTKVEHDFAISGFTTRTETETPKRP